MKLHLRKVVNFFAFNLLFFALYLNFIHQDKPAVEVSSVVSGAGAVSGAVLVQNPEQYVNKKQNEQPAAAEKEEKEVR